MKRFFKSKALFGAITSIALCASLITGATFAIFTSKAEVNVAVTSATVSVTASIENRKLYSHKDIDTYALTGTRVERTEAEGFLTGGTATYNAREGLFELDNMVPGDGVTFDVVIDNRSNVNIKYRVVVDDISETDLIDALDITVDGQKYVGKTELLWKEVPAYDEINPVAVTVELPLSAADDYQGKNVVLSVRAEAVQGNVAITDWYDEDSDSFVIGNAEQFSGMLELARRGNTFVGKTITLVNDIDLGYRDWEAIPSFKGEFNGNGKTVSGLKLDATEGSKPRSSLFGGIEAGAKIHDLVIDGVEGSVGKNGRLGVLGNYISGEVENITIKNVKATSTDPSAWVGGFCAFLSWPAVKNCTVENMEVNAPDGAEFIAGFSPILQKNSNFTFENCNVKNFKVKVTHEGSSNCGVGGFVGQTQRGWENPKMYNCNVEGIDVTAVGNVDVGGFMPYPGGHTIAENCSVSGKIDASGIGEKGCSGGFFGNLGWNCDLGQMGHQITNCTANVDITTKKAPAGGFVGSATNSNGNSMYATFTGCKALGKVECVAGGTASVGGFAGVADRGYYDNCQALGTVIGGEVTGGFIGTVKHIDAAYDGRFPVGERAYDVEQITVKGCVGAAGLELIGKDDKSNKDSLKRYHDVIITE